MKIFIKTIIICNLFALLSYNISAQEIPKILNAGNASDETYLPDFSYAGYHNGELEVPDNEGQIISA
ncbi:MAG: hypothetical protein P1P88_16465, partial [Bacteroidales bacterium]|nr:hypothetical protein [Bacteroidales bacterium]